MTRDDASRTNGGASGQGNGAANIMAKEPLRGPLPKRFYKTVAVAPEEAGFTIRLDGRPIRTPAKRPFVLPAEELAAAVAAEWTAQGERIDPAAMPLTRLANTALDAVADKMAEVADDIAGFAASDLLCYRAPGPDALVRRQADAWDPPLAWARRTLGVNFAVQTGLMPVDQPPAGIASMRAALDGLDVLSLAAAHVLTTLMGSAILTLAVIEEHLSLDEAWAAATVDERWQSEQWGHDSEAEARAAERLAEATAAARCLRLLRAR